jgi:hypothetical protein
MEEEEDFFLFEDFLTLGVTKDFLERSIGVLMLWVVTDTATVGTIMRWFVVLFNRYFIPLTTIVRLPSGSVVGARGQGG